LVHGSVVTVVGQNSMPVSTAIRSLRQNSSFWFRRRAVASNLPSSKDPFLVAIVPPKNRVGDAVTRQFESRTFEMLVFPARSAPSSKVGIFGTAGASLGYFQTKRVVTVASPTHECLRSPLSVKIYLASRGDTSINVCGTPNTDRKSCIGACAISEVVQGDRWLK